MRNYEFQREDEYFISTDKSKLQFDVIHRYLSTSYWSPNIPMEIIKRAAEGSLCFGIYKIENGEERQVGYSRIISDYATFAYLADVFVLETERGNGLSKWMMECIKGIPELQGLRRWMLATRDAHGLYAQYGFTPIDDPKPFMQINFPDIYNSMQN